MTHCDRNEQKDEVGPWSRETDPKALFAGLAQPRNIDRNRLGVPKGNSHREIQDGGEDEGAHEVNVLQRIER